ncbi:NADH dehydrogenase subunit 5 (mitochondrion) [Fukomys damarensis]|uniref:NADH-ubiquinone oxidoreductase chain 5 n=2 Tax=Bathyergidae TaxID=10167 RepID=G5CPH5_HETGA|nr:NADH dehydrogenase subunit 5 [Fukomys damarensis]AEM23562.1 NADH dehydrogenase subunit 5 [Heterocephalus glaber]AKU70853.1 NADH dehydrogenase subunit 5 [Fukomys damarensis]
MNLYISSFIMSLLLLTTPIPLSSINFPKNTSYPSYVKSIISLSFFISLIPTTMLLLSNQEAVISNWNWMHIQTVSINMSFKLDYFSVMFMSVALFVTWSIMEFSMWYMHSDPDMNKFIKYLLLFLITMMILVTANNAMQLFIGWEGVGIMSFLLIGWWLGRSDANTAALQAILYNRIGDIGFIISMVWFMTNLSSWEMQQLLIMQDEMNYIPLLGLLLAATGKSAQFGLHPWLPSAMEGPTPVSALLHSSTMVVAGIFLMIRFYPLIQHNQTILTMSMCLGATTTLFTALCALTQNDIKKIIAFSTSSQLGLMMVTIGINQPHLAFLHICMHAFFKAMLFMCAGSIIHNLNNEQDIRKMGGLLKMLPFTSSSLIIGSLALTGMPFLTGFYSKDLIIESANSSYINAWALLITLISTSLTAVYSSRIVFYALLDHPRSTTTLNINENNPLLINPIKRLAMGSILAGFIISNNIPPTSIPQMTMPTHIKLSTLMVTALGFMTAMELIIMSHYLKNKYPNKLFNFSNMLGYFTPTAHRFMPYKKLMMSQNLASSSMDAIWLEKSAPKNVSDIQYTASMFTSNQTGLIKLYFLSFLLSFMVALILST